MSNKARAPSPLDVERGTIHLGGIDALVRLALDQVRSDTRRGLKTGMMVSGYRGSPLGMLDETLMRHQQRLEAHNIRFVDGVNEDLAATAVWGSQMLGAVGRRKVDGVTGMWYGKAPGVDRSGDALKHANYTGIGPHGGVLAIAGDDPSCKSSSLASQSEPMLYHVGIPSLYPGDVQEILDLGLHGYQLSRASGLWVGMKIVTNVADGHGSAEVDPERLRFVIPELEFDGKPFVPHMNLGMNVRAEALEMERSLYTARLEMARRYARENRLNHVTLPNPDAWLGIVAAGKTYRDLMQACAELGMDEAALRRYGVRILKMGMLFPMEPQIVREFAQGLEEILVIEEKRPFLEMFAKEVLYGRANAPRIVGKLDEQERPLLPGWGEFESDVIARVLVQRLSRKARLEPAEGWLRRLDEIHGRKKLPTMARTAWYCSGCPHNSSTKPLDGSLVSAGIGCHTMSMWMDRNVVMGTHMGAEGAQWIGLAPFTEVPHIFQNIGDGTYFHSGSLAIRYAVAAGVNITYKLLHNQHVSMTGGQHAMGSHPVADIVSELLANGVKRVIVTTDQPQSYASVALSGGTEVWHRDRLQEAQAALAATPGVTVLIHDQECAAELRRARSRGKREDPAAQVLINERVCEGCGDCGVQSNCMSVEPVATEFGRKTRIHQGSCNKDYSCVQGFCPSFLTVTPREGAGAGAADGKKKRKARMPALERELPDPQRRVPQDCSIHIMGIGGTGSVTVAAMLAQAARLEGRHAVGLDQTGLAQKGGAVISDIKITREPFAGVPKISDGSADLYLGFDVLNATDPKNLDKCHPERTLAVVSTTQSPTGQMVRDRNVIFPAVRALTGGIDRVTRKGENVYLDAQALAEGLFGDSMATNSFLVGVAYQAGGLPMAAGSIEEAMRQGGVAVELSILAFRWGRMAVLDASYVQQAGQAALKAAQEGQATPDGAFLTEAVLSAEALAIVSAAGVQGEALRLLQVRVPDLIAYQNAAYAQRYAELVGRVWRAERPLGRSELTEAVARNLHKLMAYKDEYEVARLQSDPAFLAQLRSRFPNGYELRYHLAPPLLARRDPRTGELLKREYGGWMLPVFRLLARLKGLRGGPLDVFGRTEERREERRLIGEYVQLVEELAAGLDAARHALAVELASLPDDIRGYGHVKARAIDRFRERQQSLLQAWRAPREVAAESLAA
ncbi:indolepyruvate ferredoxin oxidoreductase family protein [Azohydromonas aeria]|uniref:indolepyruvate ferredoxin oxidoreductase family protein n=1 Tax=Azohydromonas aeria TaxID=2590212 RepID=UPI0012FBC639|nr:indolepyruvate ferredoxin oxidoreductase family protein [Azohydromonas aeria]